MIISGLSLCWYDDVNTKTVRSCNDDVATPTDQCSNINCPGNTDHCAPSCIGCQTRTEFCDVPGISRISKATYYGKNKLKQNLASIRIYSI